MRINIISFFFFLFLANFAQGQVKFRVKNLDADSLAAMIPNKKGTEKIDVINLLSNVICKKDIDSSLNLANNAIILSEKMEYKKGLADGYFNRGNVYFLRDTLEPTISNYLKAYRIYENLEPCQEYGNLCILLGFINAYVGKMEFVNKYMIQSKNIYEGIHDTTGMVMAYFSLGRAKSDLGEWDSSLYYFNKAFLYTDLETNQNEAGWNYIGLANLYVQQFYEYRDTAYLNLSNKTILEGLELPEMEDNTRAALYMLLVQNYMKFSTKEGDSTSSKYLEIAAKLANTSLLASWYKDEILGWMAWLYYYQGNYHKSIDLCEQSIKISNDELSGSLVEKYGDPIYTLHYKVFNWANKERVYNCLYYSYCDLGDYKTAHEYYVLAKQAAEEITQEQSKNMITLLEATSKDEKTKSQIDLLARDNELKALAIKQFRFFVFGIAGIFIVLLLMGLLFIRQNKIKNEHKSVLLEQKLLRLQMNPHFIFNAFSNILRLIDTNDNKKASAYLTTFGKLLRITLESTREDMVPFENEVGNLRNYLDLQKFRYPEKFEYSMEIDEKIDQEEMSIPPMLVQPFIENAIEHGIRHKNSPGRIDVRFILQGKKILCEVEDDGVGREKAWEAEYAERGEHISLATEIIKDRIKSLNKKFKQKIKLEIVDMRSEEFEPIGTKVLLDLPYGSVY